MAVEPNRLRAMVAGGKSNLSIALALNISIKEVILAVKELDAADERDYLRAPFNYAPSGLPDRKYRPWTTGEREAVLTSDASPKRMAKELGRTYVAVTAQRRILRREIHANR